MEKAKALFVSSNLVNSLWFYVLLIATLLLYLAYLLLKLNAYKYIHENETDLVEKYKVLSGELQGLIKKLDTYYGTYINLLDQLGLNQTYECSRAIVQSASREPPKYVIKYSNIEKSDEVIKELDLCIKYALAEEKYWSDIKKFRKSLKKQLPQYVIHLVSLDYIILSVFNLDTSIIRIKPLYFKFLYISPAGRSRAEYKIIISPHTLHSIKSEVESSISKSTHSKTQRNLMSNSLREAIKLRDNYTCCICGNSVYKEPNLLLEVDHIIPVSKGGESKADNLQTSCWRCNRQKGNNVDFT